MSRQIWKYSLTVTDRQEHSMPQGAALLTVQVQQGIPCIWADVPNTDAPPERRIFWTFGTGKPMPTDFIGEYLGTYQLYDGQLVWHVYEEI